MAIKHQKKQDENKNIIGSVVAGVAGAVAVAATMALKDEKTRKKLKKVLINVKDQAIDRVETLKIEPTVGEESNKIKKIATDTKKVVKKRI